MTENTTITGTAIAKLPKDDTYVQMNQYATNLTIPDAVRESERDKYKKEHPNKTILNMMQRFTKT